MGLSRQDSKNTDHLLQQLDQVTTYCDIPVTFQNSASFAKRMLFSDPSPSPISSLRSRQRIARVKQTMKRKAERVNYGGFGSSSNLIDPPD